MIEEVNVVPSNLLGSLMIARHQRPIMAAFKAMKRECVSFQLSPLLHIHKATRPILLTPLSA